MQIREMKNFKLETFSTDLEKAELTDFKTSNLNEMYDKVSSKTAKYYKQKCIPKNTVK